MADIADLAADRQALINNVSASLRKDVSNRPTPNGECHYCGDDVTGERIFCDSVCARKWNHEQERLKRNGR